MYSADLDTTEEEYMKLWFEIESDSEDEEKCSICGGKMIVSNGYGITGKYCTRCGNDEYDYDL